MCRIAAYLGPPIPLSRLLYDPPHALEHQAYRPRGMVSGTVNVDGTGVVWWRPGEAEPLRYVGERPPWSDPNLRDLAPRLAGSPILATVRSATPGIPSGPGAVLPFALEGLAGSHNGWLGGFRTSTCAALLERLPVDLVGTLDTLTDSAVLFRLAVARWRETGDLATAAVEAVAIAGDACATVGEPASLSLVLADADRVVAVRHARDVESNALHVLERAGGAWLASEPLDDDDWQPVPDDHVVTLVDAGVRMAAADIAASTSR